MFIVTKPRGRVAVIDFLNNGRSKESRTGHCTDEKEYEIMQECEFALLTNMIFANKQSFNIFSSNMKNIERRMYDIDYK